MGAQQATDPGTVATLRQLIVVFRTALKGDPAVLFEAIKAFVLALRAHALYAVLASAALLALFSLMQLFKLTGPGDFFPVLQAAQWGELALAAVSAEVLVKFALALIASLLAGYVVYALYVVGGMLAGLLVYVADRLGAVVFRLLDCADLLRAGYYRFTWTHSLAHRLNNWAQGERHVTQAVVALACVSFVAIGAIRVPGKVFGIELPDLGPPTVTLCFPGNQCDAVAIKRLIETQEIVFGLKADAAPRSSACELPEPKNTNARIARFARSAIKATIPGAGEEQAKVCTAMFGRGYDLKCIASNVAAIKTDLAKRCPAQPGPVTDDAAVRRDRYALDVGVIGLLGGINDGLNGLRAALDARINAPLPSRPDVEALERKLDALVTLAEESPAVPLLNSLNLGLIGLRRELGDRQSDPRIFRAQVEVLKKRLENDHDAIPKALDPPLDMSQLVGAGKGALILRFSGGSGASVNTPFDFTVRMTREDAPAAQPPFHYVVYVQTPQREQAQAELSCDPKPFEGLEIAFARGSSAFEPNRKMRSGAAAEGPSNAQMLSRIIEAFGITPDNALPIDISPAPISHYVLLGEASAEGPPGRNFELSQMRASTVCREIKRSLAPGKKVDCDEPIAGSVYSQGSGSRDRLRLVAVPLGEGHAYWQDDPGSTDRRRVRVVACHRPAISSQYPTSTK
jgi:hypothetical protein